MREAPRLNYDYDVKQVVKAYEQALKDVQAELNSLFLTDFKRAQVIATEKAIVSILSDIKKYGDNWASVTITKAAQEGVASTLFALELTSTYDEALKIVKFNAVNKRFVAAAIADTQADLLAVTQNIERQAKLAIRKATAEAMRYKLARGDNAVGDISREIRKRIVDATDVAIIDRASRRWSVKSYADMLAREKLKQAHQEAMINEALSEGALYGRVSRHSAVDRCRLYEGKIVKLVPDADGDYPYLYDIPKRDFNHVGCKHVITVLRDPSKYEEN